MLLPMKRLLPAIASIVSLAAVGALAAQRVDFSGTWVADAPLKNPKELREVVVVTQDEKGMSATFTAEGQKGGEIVRYDFGATTVQTGGPAGVVATIASTWKGDSLVAVNTMKAGDKSRTFEQTWSLDATGRLVITVVRPGAPQPRTRTYRRQEPSKTRK